VHADPSTFSRMLPVGNPSSSIEWRNAFLLSTSFSRTSAYSHRPSWEAGTPIFFPRHDCKFLAVFRDGPSLRDLFQCAFLPVKSWGSFHPNCLANQEHLLFSTCTSSENMMLFLFLLLLLPHGFLSPYMTILRYPFLCFFCPC